MINNEKALTSTTIRENDQKITRDDYFRFIRHNLDDYSKVSYTPEEALNIQRHLQKLSTGSSAMVPLYCAGEMCPFADRCVLVAMKKCQIGLQCYIESQLLNHWIMQYMSEYDVDPENFTETSYCNELAEIEVMLRRLNMSIARPQNAELVIDQSMGVDREGNPITQKQISPFMEQKEKLFNRKSKIIKLMVGDRQEKYKKEAALKVKQIDDPASKQAETRRKIETLQRTLDQIQFDHSNDSPKAAIINKDNILTPDAIIAEDEE